MSLEFLRVGKEVQPERDSLGSGSFLMDSGIEDFTIEMAYLGESSKGAVSLDLVLKGKNNGVTLRQTLYITAGAEKGRSTTYTKDGNTYQLKGFSQGNAIALLASGKALADMDITERTVNLYDYKEKKELPTTVNMLMDLVGQPVTLGILKVLENKSVNSGKDANGNNVYVKTNEAREINEIDKVFRTSDKLTLAEVTTGATEPAFYSAWAEKNTGVAKDKRTAVSGGVTGQAAPSLFSSSTPAAEPTGTKSLFGNN